MLIHNDEVLTVSEAARLLKMSPDAVRRWVRDGHLRAYRVGPRGPYRIEAAALRDYLRSGPRN